jgi:O-Antigen ligase/Tetratricopeptide repeat
MLNRARGLVPAAPAAVVAVLLLLGTWSDGAFDVRYWAPIAVLTIAFLVAMLLAGGLRIDRGPFALAVAAFWGLAAWTALSALWAESPALAWEGAGRTVLYAALVTLVAALPGRRQALRVGAVIVGGVVVIEVVTLIGLFVDGVDLFLAGRLDDPIGYRNAVATLFAFAFWPLIGFAAERGKPPPLRAVAMAAAVLALGLAFLTQSRGVVIALCVGGIVSLAIGPDRVRRSWLALAAGGGIALASGPLLDPYHAFQDGLEVTDAQVESAAEALSVLCLVILLLSLLGALLDNGLRERGGDIVRQVGAAGLAVVAVVGVVGALVAIGNPVSYADDKWDEFTDVEGASGTESTRLGSVGGQRYDLWRVAVVEFGDQPLTGVGESNYQFDYYRERRTDRNLSDPHSLPFALLSEKGIVGILLFGGFLVAIGVAIARSARSCPDNERRTVAGLAAAGAAVLGQTTTDWLWLIPTLMGLGLLALSLAAVPRGRLEDRPEPLDLGPQGDRWRAVARYGSAGLLAVAAISVAMLYLSDLYVRKARTEFDQPTEQLADAQQAEDLNPVWVTPLYLQASALESQGNTGEARAALEEALEEEPDNFVTLALLGDLEVRAGNDRAAREFYSRASEQNPLDVGLQQLARGG